MAAIGLISESHAVYEYLRSLGCCQRCCLRYLGERDSNSYSCVEATLMKVYCMSFLPNAVLLKELPNLTFVLATCFFSQAGMEKERDCESGPERKFFKYNPCIVCLGLLQEELSVDDVVQKVIL